MYYKFRDLSNYKFLLDIIINQRLYSSSFRNLNDNLEGQFYRDIDGIKERLRLNPRKNEHVSICSFSGDYKNHLMWSHYADGHRGLVIGFELQNDIYKIEKVNYNGLRTFDFRTLPKKIDEIKLVLINKSKDWEYENEFRIITEKQCYIDIKIKKIIFGAETLDFDKDLITKLISNFHPEILVETYYGY